MKYLVFIAFIFLYSCSIYTLSTVKKTGIQGVVINEHNQPVSDAYVYIYRSLSSNLIGPADFMEKTRDDGTFFFDLPEGKYYLVARKRAFGSDAGPLRQGDRAVNYQKNPVIVTANYVSSINIILPEKKSFYFKRTPMGDTPITITVSQSDLKNLKLLIYIGENTKKSPDYVVELENGRADISLNKGKTYMLIVREDLKEKVSENEFYLEYGPFSPEQVGGEITLGFSK